MKKKYLKPSCDFIDFELREALMSGTGVGGVGGASEDVGDSDGWEDDGE